MANIMIRRGLREFVPASFPVPQNPILVLRSNWDPSARNGMGDFIPAYFPVPNNPITGVAGCGKCGGDCGCADCLGMGDIAQPSWAGSLPTFMQGAVTLPGLGSVPIVYVGGTVVVLVIGLIAFTGSKRRR